MQAGANAMGVTFEEFRAQALGAVPIGRIIQPEEVASLVKFLASPQAVGDHRPDLQHLRRTDDGLR